MQEKQLTTFEEIKTERLILRKLTPEVYRFIHENYDDNRLMDFLNLKSDAELDKEKDKYKKGLSTYNRSFVNFQLMDIFTKKIVGTCGFHTWYLDHGRAEIGYALNDDVYKGKGLMSEAMKYVIDYGFNKMNLSRIEAFVGTNNTPSLRLMSKFHFVSEGLMRKHYFKNDKMEDSLVFSLLKEEYNQNQQGSSLEM